MKPKTDKTSTPRVAINTILLAIMTIAFGVMTCLGVSQIQTASKSSPLTSNSTALCYDNLQTDDAGLSIAENAYICSRKVDANCKGTRLTDPNDLAVFLYDRATLASLNHSSGLVTVLSTIGAMFTLASAAATIVYWNHNRK